ncbi:MAG: hypothetical protein ACYC1M_00395 [Armatimonadota bacterium]
MSDQDLWPIDPRVDGVDAKKSKLRQMRIFVASLMVALILVAAILIWAANDKHAKLKSSPQTYDNAYSTGTNPADNPASTPGYGISGGYSSANNTGATTSGSAHPSVAPDVRSFNKRDTVYEPSDGEDTNLRMQMLTMRDNYENQLALYRQQLEDQRQLIAAQRLIIDQLQAQNKTNTPDAQTGYAGFYRCSNCGAGMNWARTDAVPDANTGGKCPASANGQHFWIRM